MGRKQKLRAAKKLAKQARKLENTLALAPEPVGAAAAAPIESVSTPISAVDAMAIWIASEGGIAYSEEADEDEEETGVDTATILVNDMFPKSKHYVEGEQFVIDHNCQMEDIMGLGNIHQFLRGATEDGCVHSMYAVGKIYTQSESESELDSNNRQTHLGLPWLLEGSVRGSPLCAKSLVMDVYCMAKPYFPKALVSYWIKMRSDYLKWGGSSDSCNDTESKVKELKDIVEKRCAICSKTDTDSFTLRQCMGCSLHCYCSEACQTIHWEEHNHKCECKQYQILQKYHKPYAKAIRDAAVRGETTHPAVEKLRYKLGLTRPTAEYDKLCDDGRPIDPFIHNTFLVARKDGTVWAGSTPNLIGPKPSTTTTTTTTTTSAKDHIPSSDTSSTSKDDESGNVITATAKDDQSSTTTVGLLSAPAPAGAPARHRVMESLPSGTEDKDSDDDDDDDNDENEWSIDARFLEAFYNTKGHNEKCDHTKKFDPELDWDESFEDRFSQVYMNTTEYSELEDFNEETRERYPL